MMLLANIVLALMWAALIGPFTPANILVGAVVSFVALSMACAASGRSGYPRKAWAIAGLISFTLYEILISTLRVARQTLSPLSTLRPAVLAIPLEPDITDAELTLLTILFTLTPGTLGLELSDDRAFGYAHFMHVTDPEAEIRAIKLGFERRIMEIMR